MSSSRDEPQEQVRIDLWLWAVRLFKTRSLAAAACKGGKVRVGGRPTKPARMIRPGCRIELRKAVLTRSLEVKQVLSKRVGAKLVEDYVIDHTPPEVYAAAAEAGKMAAVATTARKEGGGGRPTKRDRRLWSKQAEEAVAREAAVSDLMRRRPTE